ncbi:MAG: DUF2887 domain-containing protein [Nostocaceae cyanobacterium]|nr:DUF2887 domain-containing protein [Nostocaceae cyanobacterium]
MYLLSEEKINKLYIYLDEVNQAENLSLGLSLLQLIGMKAELAGSSARELITRTCQKLADANAQKKSNSSDFQVNIIHLTPAKATPLLNKERGRG